MLVPDTTQYTISEKDEKERTPRPGLWSHRLMPSTFHLSHTQGGAMQAKTIRGKKRQEAPRSASHTTHRTRTRPQPVVAQMPQGSLHHCLKCHGWIVVQVVDLSKKREMRCLNCGWQPQYGQRTITETDEARSIRRFTAKLFSSTEQTEKRTPLEESFRRIDFSKHHKPTRRKRVSSRSKRP